MAERWPFRTWSSLKERALFQAMKLEQAAARSNGQLNVIKSAADLDKYLERRRTTPSCTAAFLGIEGAQALEGDLNNIDVFFDHGIRMMSPSHFFDTDIGGSAHGVTKGGLTEKGKEMIRRMQSKSMIVDLAHASSTAIKDTLAIATRPVIVSHTGVKGTCNNTRNLSDDELIGIARTGGVIGIGYWPQAVCGADARAIARAIRYTANLVGVDHVALGSDFDGAVTVPFDTGQLVFVTQTLIDEGFSDEEIRLIMGGNAIRMLRQNLPLN
jgi:membrane dipeptidase